MWNVAGIFLSFIGTLLTLLGILTSETKNPGSWDQLEKTLKSKGEEKLLATIGLIILSVGFSIQLGLALLAM